MKALALAALLVLPAVHASAQAAPADVHDELRKLRDEMTAAIERGDIGAVLAHLHPDVVFTPMDGRVCRGPAEVRAYFERMMKGPDRVVKAIDIDMTVDRLTDLYGAARDTGIAYGSADDRYTLSNGLAFRLHTRWTCSLVRQDGRWLITSFQTSPNLFDNPLLNRAKQAAWWAGGIAALLGLIAGFLLGRRRA
jgi:uncharacterized protein (TIGR02246 family)